MKTKVCTKCKKRKLVKHFYVDARHADKLQSQCKQCQYVVTKQYVQSHRDLIRNRQTKWRYANKEKYNEHIREYRKKNADKVSVWGKKYYKKHCEKIRQYQKLYNKNERRKCNNKLRRWRKNNQEKYLTNAQNIVTNLK